MANEEHLKFLKRQSERWNQWRKTNPKIKPDLRGASLRDVDLNGANLAMADLSEADLSGAILENVNLLEAKLLETNLSQANLKAANLSRADLSRADLNRANLSQTLMDEANLSWVEAIGTDFYRTRLRRAELKHGKLSGASLVEANLTGANLNKTLLQGADLRQAILVGANLVQASIAGANLIRTNFANADLSEAYLQGAFFNAPVFTKVNLSCAVLGDTTFADTDLSTTEGLETVRHEGPSTIGVDTIYRSKGDIPEIFLRGCGVPENLVTFMHSLTGKAFEFYSCFISHSAKDKRFCERIYADLQAKGVRTWYFPEDAKWGETVWGEIDRSIKIYDKLIVVCSENSLQSGPVNREIERALNREDKEGKDILFPIRIDDYIFETWEHERKADVVRKVVGDFSGWDKDAAKYDKAFDKLLKGLQAQM